MILFSIPAVQTKLASIVTNNIIENWGINSSSAAAILACGRAEAYGHWINENQLNKDLIIANNCLYYITLMERSHSIIN